MTRFRPPLAAMILSLLALAGGGLAASSGAASAAPVAAARSAQPVQLRLSGQSASPLSPTTKYKSTITMSIKPTSIAAGASVTLSATVRSAGATPTGSVTFSDTAGRLCSAMLSKGAAHCTHRFTSAGTFLITAKYAGDSTHLAASSGQTRLTVSRAPTSTSVTVSPSRIPAGTSAALSARVSSGDGTPTGKVVFSDSSGTLCTAILSGGGGQCRATFGKTGTYAITGKYSGDKIRAGSSRTAGLTVAKDATSTSVSVNPSDVGLGAPATMSATVSSAHGTPTGTVAFTDGSQTLCTATLTGGTATCSGAEGAASTYTVTGKYSGDATHAGSSGSTTLTVNQDGSQLAISLNPTTIAAGQPTTFTATVSAAYGTPTGSVAFSDGGNPGSGALCIAQLSGGTGSCTGSITVPGNYTVYADYSGDQSYVQSSATSTLTVSKDSTTITDAVSPATITADGSVTLSATVTAPYVTPTGDVTFFYGSYSSPTQLCIATLSAGSAQCNATVTSHGTFEVYATYSGDGADNTSGTATGQTLTVNQIPTTLSFKPSAGDVLNDATETYSATVTAASGPAPSGEVDFYVGGTEACAAPLTNGSGSCNALIYGNGNVTLKGEFVPYDSTAPASASMTLTIVPSTTYIRACVTVGNNDKESQTPVLIQIHSATYGTLYDAYVSQNQYWNDNYTNCGTVSGSNSGTYWYFKLPETLPTSGLTGATFYVYAPGDSWHGQFQAWADDNWYGELQTLETVPNMYYNDNGNLDPCSQYINYDESAYTFTFETAGATMYQTCGVAG